MIAEQQGHELELGLSAFLSQAYGDSVSVCDLKRLTGGTSHETWAFDALIDNAAQTLIPFVLRRDFSKDVLDLNLTAEFSLLTALYEQGVPIPKPHFCVEENSPIVTPFIISERLDGKDVRKVMAETPEAAISLGKRLTTIQASIHAIDWQPLVKGTELDVAGSPIDYQVSRWSDVVLENLVTPEPMLAYSIHWLQNNMPINVEPCLIHGDFKANNLLFNSAGHIAVIDWELAHIGDPYEDLAFTLLWTTQFDIVGGMLTKDNYLRCYEAVTGKEINAERLHYWQVFSWLKLAGIFLKGYNDNTSANVETPTRIMLLRSIPWINQQLGLLLNNPTQGPSL